MTSPQKFRKKPVVVEAMQWDGTAAGATPIIDWVLANGAVAVYRCNLLDAKGLCPGAETDHSIVIDGPDSFIVSVDKGDWIVCDCDGDFSLCPLEVFADNFEVSS